MNATPCRIGCAGWSLPKYLRDPSLSYLERYAQLFNCVEINSSFYRHHQLKTYARWAGAVPEDFRFSVKAPKAITHVAEADKVTLDRFLNEIRGLGDKLGPLLIQLPPKAAFKWAVASELFLSFREKFNGEIVCEPRHATWFEPESYELLQACSISLVVADPKPVSSAPGVLEHESRYYRLHGAPRIYYKELYFWTLIVAIMIFAVGGGISAYEGITHILRPRPLESPVWSYSVLGLAMVFEGFSLAVAWREFSRVKGRRGFWRAIRESKDPTIYTVLFEDSAALTGLVVAFVGIFLTEHTANPVYDGSASIVIGLLLAGVAVYLANESKGLLIGEGADRQTLDEIRRLAESDEAVERVRRPLTIYFGPHTILLTLEIQFKPTIAARDIEGVVDRIEKKIRNRFPDIKHILIEAESIEISAG